MDIVLRALISLSVWFFAAAACAASPEISLLEPWVQAAPPNAKVLAAYLRIQNTGARPHTLSAVSSPAFERVELHQTVLRENMAGMQKVGELRLPPKQTLVLKPGGLHLMLIGAKRALRTGDVVPLTLSLKDGSTLSVDAIVRGAPAGADQLHRDQDHSGHASHAH
jgi:copper(I)-binding protein